MLAFVLQHILTLLFLYFSYLACAVTRPSIIQSLMQVLIRSLLFIVSNMSFSEIDMRWLNLGGMQGVTELKESLIFPKDFESSQL